MASPQYASGVRPIRVAFVSAAAAVLHDAPGGADGDFLARTWAPPAPGSPPSQCHRMYRAGRARYYVRGVSLPRERGNITGPPLGFSTVWPLPPRRPAHVSGSGHVQKVGEMGTGRGGARPRGNVARKLSGIGSLAHHFVYLKHRRRSCHACLEPPPGPPRACLRLLAC